MMPVELTTPQRKIWSLTSLRFVAASLVAYQHAGSPAFFKNYITLFDTRTAVSFFFVLSGFILSHAHAEVTHVGRYRAFMAARFSRLWPAHAVTAAFALFMFADWSIPDLPWKALTNALMLQSWVPIMPWYYTLNSVSWSISTEMAFYSVFPFLLIASRRRPWALGVAAMAWAALMIAIAAWLGLSGVESHPGVTSWGLLYISPIGRISEFALGVAVYPIALSLRKLILSWGSTTASLVEALALVATFATMIATTRLAEFTMATVPPLSVWLRIAGPGVVFAAMISIMFAERGSFSRCLQWRPIVYLGETSFSLYLVHQLVLRTMFALDHEFVVDHSALSYIVFWAISLLLASALFHFVETPCRPCVRRLVAGSHPSKEFQALPSGAVKTPLP